MVAALLVAALSACTAGQSVSGASPAPSPADRATVDPSAVAIMPASSAPPVPSGPVGQPFPADTAADTQQATGDRLVVTAVRAGRHDGFDRVVWELEGESGTPGWRAGYTDQPVQQGSGKSFDVRGDAFLEIAIDGVTYPAADQDAAGAEQIALEGPAVTEVRNGGVFEGINDGAVGVTGELPFRVYALAAPARVVLEVVHPDRIG